MLVDLIISGVRAAERVDIFEEQEKFRHLPFNILLDIGGICFIIFPFIFLPWLAVVLLRKFKGVPQNKISNIIFFIMVIIMALFALFTALSLSSIRAFM
ncbi:MAG: hypothetical protein WC517_00590 [Patescibacteria group bacterium]